ncbi:MAG TPA: F0F1 ATP synthase subunit B [Kiritimatiellia bacterium]|jgi:F-type H+-transporting ATPase subunit b
MAEEHATTTATIEVPSHDGGAEHAQPELINLSSGMMMLTWLVFLIVTVILYKTAWKPILAALDKREEDLRKAVDDAAKTREELARIEDTRKQILGEADAKAKDIVESARRAAVDASQAIESKAREEAQILIQNAQREIGAAESRAVAALRKESADMAVNLARKIIGANLDPARSKVVTDQFIREL